MRRLVLVILLVLVAALVLSACGAQAPAPIKNPTVTLKRVEVASYFPPPWTGWPGNPPTPTPPPALPAGTVIRVPMVLAFIFDVTNPNDYAVSLTNLKFTVEFEAAPNEFFALSTPIVYETMAIPGGTTNQLRTTVVLDSAIVPGTLAVAYGQRMGKLNLTGPALVKKWWEEVGDFTFGIKVTGGTADFTSPGGKALVTFEGTFRK